MRRPLFALALLLLGACQCNARPTGPRTDAGAPRAPRRAARVGTVVGRILLAEGATLPRWSLEDIDRAGIAPPPPPECGPPRDADTLPVVGVGTPTQLVGVMISATGERQQFFDALGDWEPTDRHVAIDQCRLTPKLVTATQGDTLVLENHTDYPFLPAAGPSQFNETLLRGQSRRLPLEGGGRSWIRCGFAAGCGRSELVVIYHPVHTVSRADGTFEITNVPADMEIGLHAWHPSFRESLQTIRVPRGGRITVDFTLTPLTPRARPDAGLPPYDPREHFAGPESDLPPDFFESPSGMGSSMRR